MSETTPETTPEPQHDTSIDPTTAMTPPTGDDAVEDADATQNDALTEQTDNAPTEDDGDQASVSQEATDEAEVQEDGDGEPAP